MTIERYMPDEEDLQANSASMNVYHIVVPIVGILVVLINLSVVVSSGLILKSGHEPKSTYLFLGNVALCDLLSAVAILFGIIFPTEKRNHTICAIQLGLIVSSALASVYSVGLIAFDRFLYILHGMKYQFWIYPQRTRILIVAVWLLGCTIGFLPLMGWHGDTDNGRICWFILMAPKQLILLTVTLGGLPIFSVVLLYSAILYRAYKAIGTLQDTTANPQHTGNLRRIRRDNRINTPSRWKAVKVILFTFGSFVITWCPYFVACVIYTSSCDVESVMCDRLQFWIASPLAMLGFANSLVNPVIYAWWHKGFRAFILRRIHTYRRRRRMTAEISHISGATAQYGSSLRSIWSCRAGKIEVTHGETE